MPNQQNPLPDPGRSGFGGRQSSPNDGRPGPSVSVPALFRLSPDDVRNPPPTLRRPPLANGVFSRSAATAPPVFSTVNRGPCRLGRGIRRTRPRLSAAFGAVRRPLAVSGYPAASGAVRRPLAISGCRCLTRSNPRPYTATPALVRADARSPAFKNDPKTPVFIGCEHPRHAGDH